MKKLLVIDDESVVRKALASQFNADEVEVLTAADGAEGLEIALKEKPDLLMVDLLMPKMDGLAMLEKLRADDWGKSVNVIVLSNFGEEEKIAAAQAYGIVDYLVKVNWNVADVVSKIKKELGI